MRRVFHVVVDEGLADDNATNGFLAGGILAHVTPKRGTYAEDCYELLQVQWHDEDGNVRAFDADCSVVDPLEWTAAGEFCG